MKRILFPIEITENQKNSFVYAAKLAHYLNAELILLSSYPSFNSKENFNDYQVYIRNKMLEINEYILSLKKFYLERFSPIGDFLNIKIEYRYKEGNLMHHIFSICDSEEIDFIVFTLYNHRSKDEKHASSLVNKFSAKKVDLLIVPEDSYYLHLGNILYTSNFESPLNMHVLERVNQIIKHLKTSLHILHSQYLSKESSEYTYLKSLKKALRTLEIHQIKDLNDIMHYCLLHELNLMIIQKKERKFFEKIFKESFTQKILIQTKIPVMILMEKQEN